MNSNMDYISIKDATTHNLKHIDLKIPKHKISVFTGVSGSGKSSLVFSTLAAESQRQINKTYSSYIQQLLPKFETPDVASIKNLPFSIVVNQKQLNGNIRSTVGTYSEIYTGLRLLFSRIAKPFIGYSMKYSFNNPEGMCPECQGIGRTHKVKIEKLVSFEKSLNQGAINFPTFQPGGWRLMRYTESGFFDSNLPLESWSKDKLELLLHGKEQKPKNPTAKWHKTAKYVGIIPRIESTFLQKENTQYKTNIKEITQTIICPYCHGSRLNQQALSAKIMDTNIAACCSTSLNNLHHWLKKITNVSANISIITEDLITKIRNLQTVGLGYLSLNRETATLSGGEAQRLKLANYLNSPLNDILYIFDEPSTGLHPHDLEGIKRIFIELRNKGNTLAIVDHDPEIIKIADQIFNLGELAGEKGGLLTYQGSVQGLLSSDTLTGKYLRDKGHLIPSNEVKKASSFYNLENVSKFNIKNLCVRFPKKALTVITGVAGSGKSTLIDIFKEKYSNTAILNQRPVHSSRRSNVLTYLGVFDSLRHFFSKSTGKSASIFSFNGKGACPVCKGTGVIKLDLAYMGDTSEICEACGGTRYSKKTLSLKYRGHSIADVLNLSVNQAENLFQGELNIALKNLAKVDLGYIKLGQSLDTFSGGELQRVKLAKFLSQSNSNTLVLDEPTSGLHEANIQSLIDLLKNLIKDKEITILVIEHNLRVMGQADWLIDIGPLAGKNGGKVQFQGYPSEIIKQKSNLTVQALQAYFSEECDKNH